MDFTTVDPIFIVQSKMSESQILHLTIPPKIDVYPFNVLTDNTPNSKFPVLVYRNVLNPKVIDEARSEKEYQDQLNKLLVANRWDALGTFGTFTTTHYHPNVHECYAVTKGHSTYFLGLDVTYTPEDLTEEEIEQLPEHLKITIRKGDVLIVPSGVSHCSHVVDEGFKYVAAYPVNGAKWSGISKEEVEKAKPGKYDNSKDIKAIAEVPFPLGDPLYGKARNSLLDIWNNA